MSNRKKLSVNSVEFEDIKNNIKDFLRGQETFKDYDFDGSGLSVLIDTLAYNTYYQAFYNNVVANEMFLDSAVKRSSVVSHAKTLGYTPNSKTAATAIVDLTFGSNPGTSVLLPGAIFTTKINNKSYTFVNTESATIVSTSGVYKVSDLHIKEGSLDSLSYIVPDTDNNTKYTITDPNVDISTVAIRVQSSQTDTTGLTDKWTRADDLTKISSTANTYFIEENTDGNFEILFGDGVIGKKPEPGNLITITFLVTNGTEGNGGGQGDSESARAFRYLNASNTVEVTSVAIGGADKESVDDIRFKAPRAYTTQNRAVTEEDYVSLVESNFTGIDSVFVYGGEEADPPTFGSVFVAVKPTTGEIVSDSFKRSISNYLSTKAVLSITPTVIDPDYTYMRFNISSTYDPTKTRLDSTSIGNAIRSSVERNIKTNLGKFNKSFSTSKFLTDVDSSSDSIDSTSVKITMEKRLRPTTSKTISYVLNFGNPITHPHDGHIAVVSSGDFVYLDPNDNENKTVYLQDDGFGNISFFQTINASPVLVAQNIGSIDYEKGIIRLNNAQIQSPPDTPYISIFANSSVQRYISLRDKILTNDSTDTSSISITVNGIDQSTSTNVGNSVNVSGLNTVTSTTSSSSSSSSPSSDSGSRPSLGSGY